MLAFPGVCQRVGGPRRPKGTESLMSLTHIKRVCSYASRFQSTSFEFVFWDCCAARDAAWPRLLSAI